MEGFMPKLIELKNTKKQFTVVNKTETVSEILLYGPIGDSFWDDSAVSAKQFSDTLKEIPSSVKEIHLRVNSPGGSVFDGVTIHERIKSERAKGRKVVAYVDGIAASIASVIIQAADEIIIGDGGMVMIHKPLVGIYGNAHELEKMITVLDKIEEQMITIYQKKTGQTRLEISNAMSAETWYTAEEAIEVGLANSKIEAKDSYQLAASMIEDCSWMKNKPKIKDPRNALVREKLREFNNRVKSFSDSKKK
jgi:ATP-dependent Clp protease protease subunit